MSSSESSSPEPEIVLKKSKKKSKVSKKANKNAQPVVTSHGKNEGDNPDWSYKPPEGTIPMEHHVDSGYFDWDAVENDDNLELWVIRVPEGVKPKHLEDLKLDAPSTSKTSRIGSIDRKHTSYDVWSLGDHDEDESVGGEELRGLSCLLPRQKKGGKLYQAPKPVARHLVISARPTLPTPAHSSDSSSQSSPLTSHNPARFCYPKEVLKHRFMPLGSLAPVEDLSEIEVDAALLVKKPSHQSHTAAQERGDTSGKKRKGGGDVPKKSKKAKTAV